MTNAIRALVVVLGLLWPSLGICQGVIPLALAQQQDINGRPLAGALLYIYQVGTVATRQDSFPDVSLNPAAPNPWPLVADVTGRIPMFYLANGFVHVRLTDALGVVQLDNPNMQVTGPSGGGGGGGATIDPTTIAAVGDIKFRLDSATPTGWVKANGQSIGRSGCTGCTGRANDDTANLYTYIWNFCDQAHCPVVGASRLASAAANFSAGNPITLPDFRGRSPVGLDDMGSTAAGRIAAGNVTSGGGDGPTTAFATGGIASHTMIVSEMAPHVHVLTDPGHFHTIAPMRAGAQITVGGTTGVYASDTSSKDTGTKVTGLTIDNGSGTMLSTPFGTIGPFILGSYFMKL